MSRLDSFEVMFCAALAGTEDAVRLAKLEHAGYFPAGFTQGEMERTCAYLTRVAWLGVKRAWSSPYPGPSITYFNYPGRFGPPGQWKDMDEWKADPLRNTNPTEFWSETYSRLQEIFGTKG